MGRPDGFRDSQEVYMLKQLIKLQCLRLAVAAGVEPDNVIRLAKDFHSWVTE